MLNRMTQIKESRPPKPPEEEILRLYTITEDLQVLRKYRDKFNRKPKSRKFATRNGYKILVVTIWPWKYYYQLHRLIALKFIPNPLNLPFINHINGDKSDNRPSNMEWCTCKENIQHAFETGLNKGKRSLSKDQLTELLKLRSCGETVQYLAKKFNKSKSTISAIISGKTYKNNKFCVWR
jgi:hypothetical protein